MKKRDGVNTGKDPALDEWWVLVVWLLTSTGLGVMRLLGGLGVALSMWQSYARLRDVSDKGTGAMTFFVDWGLIMHLPTFCLCPENSALAKSGFPSPRVARFSK